MDWGLWEPIDAALIHADLAPILAVVPDNQDPTLRIERANPLFWDRVRSWQRRGWTIGLHGFQHLYVSNDAGLVGRRAKSEFAGLPLEEQRSKLDRAVAVF